MPDKPFVDPYQYQIREAIISHSRNSSINKIDIAATIMEMEFYESIDSLGVYGSLTFADTARVMEMIDFQGTELLTVSISNNPESAPLKRTFRIVNIVTGQKTGDQAEVFILSLLDHHSFINQATKLSKTYVGKPSEIIQTVMKDAFLDEKNLIFNPARVEIQEAMKFIAPHLTPFQVIELMTNRATGPAGTPFYCWSVFADDHLRYGDLKDILSFAPLFNKQPLKFNSAFTQENILNPDQQALHIANIQYDDQENTLEMISNGDVGATYDYYDTSGGYTNSIFFDIKTMIGTLFKTTPGLPNQAFPNFDTNTLLRGQPIHQLNARQFSTMSTTYTYNDYPSYNEDQTTNYHRAKFTQKAMRNLLRKSTIKIQVPGRRFFPIPKSRGSTRPYEGGYSVRRTQEAYNMTVGNKVQIAIANNDPDGNFSDSRSRENKLDTKRSGPYIILKAKHHFVMDRYIVNLELGKLSSVESNVERPSVLGTGAR